MKPHSLVTWALLATAACGTQETALSEPDPTEPVHTAPKADKPKAPEFVGVIASKVSKVIAPPFDGPVKELFVRSGQAIKAGQIVAELDTAKLASDLAAAEGQYQAARGEAGRAGAMLANAARQSKNQARLVKLGAAAPEAYNSALAERASYGGASSAAAGQVASAAAKIKELKELMAKAKVTAPIDGVVSVVKVQEGQNASRAEHIARVFDPTQLVVRFAVPKKHLALIKPGATQVQLVTNDGGRLVPATVKHKDDTADPSIDFIVFEAAIDPNFRIGEIRVGDNGHVRIAGAAK